MSTRRRVPDGRRAEYAAAWRHLAAVAETLDAHAWVFRAADGEPVYVEFLEYSAAADPRTDRRVGEALRALDAVAPPVEIAEWAEAGLAADGGAGARAG